MNTFDVSRIRLAIHGGAGDLAPGAGPQPEQRAALARIAESARNILIRGGTATDAVEHAVVLLEDCPLFNAGIGSVLTRDGLPEMDASIMVGANRACGAVTGVSRSRSPIKLARVVMERSNHVLFSGLGAEAFAAEMGLERVEPEFFVTEHRRQQLKRAQEKGVIVLDHDTTHEQDHCADAEPKPATPDAAFGTVGAVARDGTGGLAAATSTGGLTNKAPGRIGDTPLVGVGTFADDTTVAVSCTGTGESFIKACFGYEIHARMAYAGWSLRRAAQHAVDEVQRYNGRGGCIAIAKNGEIFMPFNSYVMFRAWVGADGGVCVGVEPEDGLGQ